MGETYTIPHNREAEEAVIGSILINPTMFWNIAKIIKSGDFYVHRNRWIYEVFSELVQKGIEIDLLTVSSHLSAGKLEEAGGTSYLTSLINQVPSSLNCESYAEIVREMSERRKGIQFANKIASAAYSADNFSLREQATAIVQSDGGAKNRVDTRTAASRMIDRIVSEPNFCVFGIKNQDAAVGGFFADELYIIAGYQGTGKSALKIHSARANARLGKRVVLCSLEMSGEQVWLRVACGDLGVDINQVRSGRVDAETKGKIARYAAELAEKYYDTIIIYEAPMTPLDILAAAMMEKPDILYIDHLDLINGRPSKESKMDWYNYCTRFLRQNVAKGDNHIPVVLLHQLSRGASREKRRPTKHDLAYAGENDSDGIYLLHRLDDEKIVETADIEIITAKSRFGWTGTQLTRFHLLEQKFAPPANFRDEETSWMDRADMGD